LYEVVDFFTMRVLGQTTDDAAGEAFDKIAKLLQLGYPGGVVIERLAETGDPQAFELPRPMRHSGDLQMSFSGLKTAVRRLVEEAGGLANVPLADLAASFQAAVVDTLVHKAMLAMELSGLSRLVICGGVSANRRLRALAAKECERQGCELTLPAFAYCTDNAAMIAAAGFQRLVAGQRSGLDLNSFATLAEAPR
jgi:N6-L-threonylcarbamoyladenine synthase